MLMWNGRKMEVKKFEFLNNFIFVLRPLASNYITIIHAFTMDVLAYQLNERTVCVQFKGRSLPTNIPAASSAPSATAAASVPSPSEATTTTGAAGASVETVSEEKLPLHWIVLLDNSGSMDDGKKLTHAVQSLTVALDYMGPSDLLSLVTFESSIMPCFTCRVMTEANKDIVRASLSSIKPMGGTNIAGALSSVHEIMGSATAELRTSVLLLTDGEATVGPRSDEELLHYTTELLAAYPALTLHTVGYGIHHMDRLLRAIAGEGAGSYNVVNNLDNVAGVFGDILGGLVSCVASQVRMSVSPATRQVTRYSNRVVAGEPEIYIGDLLAQGQHTVVLENCEDTRFVIRAADTTTGMPYCFIVGLSPATPALLEEGQLAHIRSRVTTLLDDVNQGLTRLAIRHEAHLSRCDELLAELRALPGSSEMVRALLAQCENCRSLILMPPPPALSRMISTQMTQNAACLGTGRGLLSATEDPLPESVTRGATAWSGAGLLTRDPTTTSVFATPTQRNHSQAMRNATCEDTPVNYIDVSGNFNTPPPPPSSPRFG